MFEMAGVRVNETKIKLRSLTYLGFEISRVKYQRYANASQVSGRRLGFKITGRSGYPAGFETAGSTPPSSIKDIHLSDFIHFFCPRCSSRVGKSGGRQDINLAKGCWYRGIVAHEIGESTAKYNVVHYNCFNGLVIILYNSYSLEENNVPMPLP